MGLESGSQFASGALAKVSCALGLIALLVAIASVLFIGGQTAYGVCQFLLMLSLVTPVFAILAVVLGHFGQRAASEVGFAKVGYGSGYLSLLIFAVFFFSGRVGVSPCGERPASNVTSAIGNVRTLNAAEITYADAYHTGYSPDLASLGPPATGKTPTASAAGLIDEVLATGRKVGYVFTYTPGPRGADGKIHSYTITARPIEYGKTGDRNLFTDQTGVIRWVQQDRPATAEDPAIAER